jgi:hypothetical protein
VSVNSAAYVECASRVDCLGVVAGEAGVSVVVIAEFGVLLIGPLGAAILYQFCWAELSAGWLALVLVSRGGGPPVVYKLSVLGCEDGWMEGVRTVWLTEGKEFELSV